MCQKKEKERWIPISSVGTRRRGRGRGRIFGKELKIGGGSMTKRSKGPGRLQPTNGPIIGERGTFKPEQINAIRAILKKGGAAGGGLRIEDTPSSEKGRSVVKGGQRCPSKQMKALGCAGPSHQYKKRKICFHPKSG